MKNDQRTAAQKQSEERLAYWIIMGFTGLISAATGAIVVGVAGAWIEPWLGFRITWWMGLLAGLVFGLLAGFLQARWGYKHSRAFTKQMASSGLLPLDLDDGQNVSRNIKMMFVGKDVRLWHSHFRSQDGAHVVIAEMGIEESFENDNADDSEIKQTCCYIEYDNVQFPEFQLQPQGAGSAIVGKLIGTEDISFADSDSFSRKYSLNGSPEAAVKQLFDESIRKLVLRSQGLTVRARKNRLLIYHQNELVPVERLAGFLRQSLNIANAFHDSGADIPLESLKKPDSKTAALQMADRMNGIVGKMLGAWLKKEIQNKAIESDEISSFLKQPVPRSIPRQLKNQLKADRFLVIMGCMFAFAGSLISVVFGCSTLDSQSRLISVAAGISIASIGGFIVLLVKIFEHRRFRILTHGRVRQAVLEEVTESPFVNGNVRVYDVRLRFVDGEGETARTRAQGSPIAAAIELSETGETTRVLQDSAKPNRLLLIDCHAIQLPRHGRKGVRNL